MSETLAAVRDLPVGVILPVNGTSFRQDQVHAVVEGEPVTITHNPLDGFDPHACAVTTPAGVQLGFVPKALAARLAANHPGGHWTGEVVEVLRGQTWGLRIRLGRLLHQGHAAQPGAAEPGLRHRGDGVIQDDDNLILAEAEAIPEPSPDAGQDQSSPRQVHAKSGRRLGTLVRAADGRVSVLTAAGDLADYPRAVVVISD